MAASPPTPEKNAGTSRPRTPAKGSRVLGGPQSRQHVMENNLVKLLYFGMACHYSIAPWYPPYQPFSGIDRALSTLFRG